MPESINTLYRVQKRDAAKAGEILADAFQDDPVWSRIFSEADYKRRNISGWFEGAVRYCLKYGEVYAPSERLEGIVNLVPGELSYLKMWQMIRSGSMKAGLKMGLFMSVHAAKMRAVFMPLETDRKAHMTNRPYLYLMTLGVARSYQGQGHGSMLIEAAIHKSEESRLPLYLETETEANVRMYEQHGFKVLKKFTLPIIKQPMWEMVREPK